MKAKHRNKYLIQPMGSTCWVRTTAAAIKQLREYHGKDRVTVDRRESEGLTVHFIEISFNHEE